MAGHRVIPPDNPRLGPLLDERDRFRIQLSLAEERPSNEAPLNALRASISEKESQNRLFYPSKD